MGGPLTPDDAAIGVLRARLSAANFGADAIRDTLKSEGDVLSRSVDIPVHLRRLEERPGALAALIKLFILDVAVSGAEVESALAPLTLERLRGLGLIEGGTAGGPVRAAVRVVPHEDLLVVSDRRLRPGEAAPADHVPGVHRPSVTLAHLTVRQPAARALDLGTGCGIQALLLARHCERVVGTDVNPRALNFADFNGRLNGARNIELREGSWFAPVAGERFDVIVANPPYVISPESRYVYRDSGMPGDSVSEQVVRAVPAHLEEGGFGTVMLSWIHRSEEDPSGPLRRWVEGSGCDAWLLYYATEDPLTAAARWNETEAADAVAYSRVIDRWLAYYRELGVESIAYGTAVLRRRSGGRNWVRVDPMPAGRLSAASDHVLRVFSAHDHLAELGDARGLLGERLALAERHRVTQGMRARGGRYVVDEVRLSLEEGLGFQATVDGRTAEVLARLDGRRPLGEVLEELAAAAPPEEREKLVTAGLEIATRMYVLGILARH